MEIKADQPSIVTMELRICTLCLDGKAGECHSPGCMFWMCPAITAEQAQRLRDWAFTDIAAVLARTEADG